MAAWEEEKSPLHGSNEGLSFDNVMNNNNGNRCTAGDGNTQASSGHASHDGVTETLH